MKSYFSSRFFEQNRQKLSKLFTGTAPIVVTANGLLQRGADSTFAFEQDANFWYLTGIDEPDIILVIDSDGEYLIVPPREASRQAFDGSVDFSELSRRSGITKVYEEPEGWELLTRRLKKVQHVATPAAPAAYVEQFGLYTNPARARLEERLKSVKIGLQLVDIAPHLVGMRMIKQLSELKAIQEAVSITAETLENLNKLSNYDFEYELEADITRGFRWLGADGHAFEPIVAGGKRACTLHNVSNNGQFGPDELVLMDVGAQVEHYAADISRTLSRGEPTERQQAVHAAVLEVQSFALTLLKPGIFLREYEQKVEEFLGEKLRQLRVIKTADHQTIRKFYPHGTSHFLGLNVHDAGDYKRPLEPGMVLTCEPGIYLPKEGIGVRIEDDVLITARGNKVLSDKLPKAL